MFFTGSKTTIYSKKNTRLLFLISLLLIAFIFLISGAITYQQFKKNIKENELHSQEQMGHIVSRLVEQYFNTLKILINITADSPEIKSELPKNELDEIYQKIKPNYAKKIISQEQILTFLLDTIHAKKISPSNLNHLGSGNLKNWQLFKGLPIRDKYGNLLAKEKRGNIHNLLKNYKDIHYVFFVRPNGDVIFIEPYEVQKNSNIFNYAFRDSLKLVNINKKTSVSEIHISNDQDNTQSITVSTPVFNQEGKINYILGFSISAKVLKDRIFLPLKENVYTNGSTFYLLDRHAHVISSSSGKNIYFPISKKLDDKSDPGNLRNYPIFNEIRWIPDIFEKGNSLSRNTFNWDYSTLKKAYHGQYINNDNVLVIATFFPISLDNRTLKWGILIETPLNQILTSENYLQEIFFISACFLALLLILIFIFSIKNFSRLEFQISKKEEEFIKLTTQVVHDIRSPLVALDMLLDNLESIEERKRVVVQKSIHRINDIANNLLLRAKGSTPNQFVSTLSINDQKPESIFLILDNIIAEKRYEYSKSSVIIQLNISENSYNCFTLLNLATFKRIISNLINNSIEATNYDGTITITLNSNEKNIFICIEDNGCGIPENILYRIGEPGFSFNKQNGNGYGLFYAKKYIKELTGQFFIQSTVNRGTKITIYLPKSKSPTWFCNLINVKDDSVIAVIDDDSSIHDIWDEKFSQMPSLHIHHFLKSPDFLEDKNIISNTDLFLIDYELLPKKLSGLDIIEEFNLAHKSILVTSHFESASVRTRCEKLNLKIIPKTFVPYIQIKTVDPQKTHDIILIDNDEIVCSSWIFAASKAGISLLTYSSPHEFNRDSKKLLKDTPIYIDSDLDEGIKGELFAKELYKEGFTNIHISTGYPQNQFKNIPWIKSVIGKEPPFLIKT